MELEDSGSEVGYDEFEVEEVVFCSVGGDGFVGLFISSTGFGSETWGPMK